MGVMDLQRMDRTLVGFLEKPCLGIVSVVQRLAQENLNNWSRPPKGRQPGRRRPIPFPPKTLVNALVEVGREVDNRWQADSLSEEYLRRYADEKGSGSLPSLDEESGWSSKNACSPGVPPRQPYGEETTPEITIDLFNQWAP
jgi:hypothetical protein